MLMCDEVAYFVPFCPCGKKLMVFLNHLELIRLRMSGLQTSHFVHGFDPLNTYAKVKIRTNRPNS